MPTRRVKQKPPQAATDVSRVRAAVTETARENAVERVRQEGDQAVAGASWRRNEKSSWSRMTRTRPRLPYLTQGMRRSMSMCSHAIQSGIANGCGTRARCSWGAKRPLPMATRQSGQTTRFACRPAARLATLAAYGWGDTSKSSPIND